MTDDHIGGFDFDAWDRENPGTQLPVVITDDMLKRRVAWDTVPCSIAKEVMKRLELPPASDEIEATEHQESHARLGEIEPLGPFLVNMTVAAAEAIRAAMIEVHGESLVEETGLNTERLTPLLLNSTIAVLAELNDIGLIHIPPMTGVLYT